MVEANPYQPLTTSLLDEAHYQKRSATGEKAVYIGTQGVPHEDEALEVLSQLGVNNIAQSPTEPWSEWTTDLLVSMRETVSYTHLTLPTILLV